MKYIIFEQRHYGNVVKVPHIFPHTIIHAEFAEYLPGRPISAGFVQIKDGKFEAYGESETLRLKSLPGDSDIINVEMARTY